MTHLPDPADRPSADQPDAASMLDVISQSMDQHAAAMKAARAMIALYAIRALLDGANVLQVAYQCGFGRADGESHQEAPDESEIESILSQMGLPPFMASQVQVLGMGGPSGGSNPVCDLHNFLGKALSEFIHDQAEKQGGRS